MTQPHPPQLTLLLAWRQSWELWRRLTLCASDSSVALASSQLRMQCRCNSCWQECVGAKSFTRDKFYQALILGVKGRQCERKAWE